MSPRPASFLVTQQASEFKGLLERMATQPLHEFCPFAAGAEPAAAGFALALAASWASGLIWVGEEGVLAEDGAPYPVGLTQYGLDPAKLIVVRAQKREEALWAAEQGLKARGGIVICALGGRGKPLELKATRRLLLFAERNCSRCLLVRPLTEASAAWTRWRVDYAQSNGQGDEIGQPSFALELLRSRAGPAGARFILDWNADVRRLEERFQEKLAPVFPPLARQK